MNNNDNFDKPSKRFYLILLEIFLSLIAKVTNFIICLYSFYQKIIIIIYIFNESFYIVFVGIPFGMFCIMRCIIYSMD